MNAFSEIQQLLHEKNIPLNPVLPEAEVTEFEKSQGITLPEEYRLFITTAGNGGSGPPEVSPFPPLGEFDIDPGYNKVLKSIYANYKNLAKAFPYESDFVWEDEKYSDEQQGEFSIKARWGCIYLGTDGCGQDWQLIVNGKQKGFVWQVADAGVSQGAEPQKFLDWYLKWLKTADIVTASDNNTQKQNIAKQPGLLDKLRQIFNKK